MPSPPPLVIRHTHHSPERPLLEQDVLPQIPPRSRSIPIDTVTPRPQMSSSSYRSDVSVMSEISESLRTTSPAPLSSASSVPTPYTIRTPASSDGSSMTVRHADNFPGGSSSSDYDLDVPPGGLLRVKSFPHNGDLLGNSNESSSGRRTRSCTPADEMSAENAMDVDPAQDQDFEHDQERHERPSRERHASPDGTSFQPFRDIERPVSRTFESSMAVPLVSSSPGVRGGSSARSLSNLGNRAEEDHVAHGPWNYRGQQTLEQRNPGLDGLGTFSSYAGNDLLPAQRLESSRRFMPPAYAPSENNSTGSEQNEEYRPLLGSGTRHLSSPVPIREISHNHISPAVRYSVFGVDASHNLQTATSNPIRSDFSSLPSPVSNVGASGSPGALERRIDTIEARLDRVRQRNQRSLPMPPGLSAHNHDGLRSRAGGPHPYELPAPSAMRLRPTPQAFAEEQQRSNLGRERPRSSWPDHSASPSIPPPRPSSIFGWETSSVPPEERYRMRSQPRLSALDADNDHERVEARSRYYQQQLDTLHALRSHPLGSSSLFRLANSIGVDTPAEDVTTSQQGTNDVDRREDFSGARLLNSLGMIAHETDAGPMSRPSSRRWISFDEGERAHDRGDQRSRLEDPIGTWNRDIHEAIGRRLSQPRPHMTSVSRRLREQIGPDWEDTRAMETTSADPYDPSAVPLPPADRSLWGEVGGVSSTLDSLLPDPPSSSNGPSAITDRRPRSRDTLGNADSTLLPRLRYTTDLPLFRGGPDGPDWHMFSSDPDAYPDSHIAPMGFAYINSFQRIYGPRSQLQLTDDMSAEDKAKVVEMVARGVSRLPSGPRKKAAESMLETVPWGKLGDPSMQKDDYCSVCHDDYEEFDAIAITPCKHMYHKDCLDTWLNQPNISSCPMCRRDLAVLACLTKMVPSKAREDALPLWALP
ncbi:hypothetical protein IAR55_006505 [Kwoniella newhampshirensis]|uniref:RING-type domain-containing protein n=1 Tax=Kwoniella newhampshirensis TaxID=1651941 RepID=A0AAW0YEU5_9TREE